VTFEKRCTIEPDDLVALQFECRNCKSFIRIPIAKVNQESLAKLAVESCRQCGTSYGIAYDTQELTDFVAFVAALGKMAPAMKGRNLIVKMEINCPDRDSQ
jgi:hypothetical protein